MLGRQYFLYMSERDDNAIWLSSSEGFRAVMKHAEDDPASLVAKHLAWTDPPEPAGQ
jgi:hypothetical protein